MFLVFAFQEDLTWPDSPKVVLFISVYIIESRFELTCRYVFIHGVWSHQGTREIFVCYSDERVPARDKKHHLFTTAFGSAPFIRGIYSIGLCLSKYQQIEPIPVCKLIGSPPPTKLRPSVKWKWGFRCPLESLECIIFIISQVSSMDELLCRRWVYKYKF